MTDPAKEKPVLRDYVAFISYRHTDNAQEGRQWASWLHHSLETYEVPEDLVGTRNSRGNTIPARLYPVFRDEEELPADADLSNTIVTALEASRYLVVLCSPNAVASRFVADEIVQFKRMGKGAQVMAAILSGEPNAAQAADECFPVPLRCDLDADGRVGKTPAEPIAADFRLPDGSEGWTNPEAYRQALRAQGVDAADIEKRVTAYSQRLESMKLKVIAGMLGVPLGVLTERDKAYRLLKERQRSRTLRRWLAAVTVLALLAVAGGGLALVKQREAQQKQAEVIAALANSDFQQGARALEEPDTTPQGMALLARAVRSAGHERATARLWTLLQQRDFWLPVESAGALPAASESAGADIPAAVKQRFAQVEKDGETHRPTLSISENGKRVATVIGDIAEGVDAALRVWNSDGSPVTPWYAPDYDGLFYIQALDAYLSPDGRVIAAVAAPNREPQYIELREVDSMTRWGDPITATGLGPHHQFARFSRVKFLDADNPPGDSHAVKLLVASEKGDAAVHSYRDGFGGPLAQNQHRTAVTHADVDDRQQWLLSASVDGEVQVSTLDDGEPLGNPVNLDSPATALRRTGDKGLAVSLASGGERLFELRQRWAVPPPQATVTEPGGQCVDWRIRENLPDDGVALRHAGNGLEVLYVSKREFAVNQPGGDPGTPRARTFDADLALVCLSKRADMILTTTTDFVTEAWSLRGLQRIGRPLHEYRLFGPGNTPEETRAVRLSPDGRSVLIHSFLWIPPNAAKHWFSLWDLDSGQRLMDRTRYIDDGFSDKTVEFAEFDDSGRYLLFLQRDRDKQFEILSALQVRPPTGVERWLPGLAEHIAGVAYDSSGNLEPVEGRVEGLKRGFGWLALSGK